MFDFLRFYRFWFLLFCLSVFLCSLNEGDTELPLRLTGSKTQKEKKKVSFPTSTSKHLANDETWCFQDY